MSVLKFVVLAAWTVVLVAGQPPLSPTDSTTSSTTSSTATSTTANPKGATTQGTTKTTKAAKSTTTTKPVQVNCINQNFEVLDECCRESPENFFPKDARYGCYLNNWESWVDSTTCATRQYMLNKWQTANGYQLDLTSEVAHKRLEKQKCYVECLFANQGLLESNKSLKYEKMENYFKSVVSELSRPLVVNATNSCSKIVPAILPSHTRSNDACPPGPFLFVQCMRKEIILDCTLPTIPDTPKNKGGFRAYAEMCDNRRKNLKTCDVLKI